MYGICEICSEAFSSKIFLKIHNGKSHNLNVNCSACNKNVRNLVRHTKLYCRKILRSNKKEYSCEFCVKPFSSKKLLRIHTNKDHLSKMYCRHCKISLSTEEHDEHLLSCCTEGNVKCEYCEIDFNCSTILMGHQTRKHGKPRTNKELSCEICLKTFSKVRYLTEHKRKIHEGIKRKDESLFKCEFCDKTFETNLKLDSHQRLAHKQPRQKCGLCVKTFLTKRLLKIHIQNFHDLGQKNKITCEYCKKVFIRYNSIRRHIRDVHEKKRDHKCYICHKTFQRHVQLTTHIELIHNLESSKNFICENCGNAFQTKQSVDIHKKNFHIDIKKFKCDICEKIFSILGNMVAHKSSVHGLKNSQFKCEKCGRLFHRKSILNKHMKIHMKLDLACTICKKNFTNKQNLYTHFRYQHNENFQCVDCNQSFKVARNLDNHYLKVHENSNKVNQPSFGVENQVVPDELISGEITQHFKQLREENHVTEDQPETDPLKIELDIKPEPIQIDPLIFEVENKLEPI